MLEARGVVSGLVQHWQISSLVDDKPLKLNRYTKKQENSSEVFNRKVRYAERNIITWLKHREQFRGIQQKGSLCRKEYYYLFETSRTVQRYSTERFAMKKGILLLV